MAAKRAKIAEFQKEFTRALTKAEEDAVSVQAVRDGQIAGSQPGALALPLPLLPPPEPFPQAMENFDHTSVRLFGPSEYSAFNGAAAPPGKYIAMGAARKGDDPVFIIGSFVADPNPDADFVATSNVTLGFPCAKPLMNSATGSYNLKPSDKLILPIKFEDQALSAGFNRMRAVFVDLVHAKRADVSSKDDKIATALSLEQSGGDEGSQLFADAQRAATSAWVAPFVSSGYQDKGFESIVRVAGWAHLVTAVPTKNAKESGKAYIDRVEYANRVWHKGSYDPPFRPEDTRIEMLVGFSSSGKPRTVPYCPDVVGGTARTNVKGELLWRAFSPADIPRNAPLMIVTKQPKVHFAGKQGSFQLPALKIVFAQPKFKVSSAHAVTESITEELSPAETAALFNTELRGLLPPPPPALRLRDSEDEDMMAAASAAEHRELKVNGEPFKAASQLL